MKKEKELLNGSWKDVIVNYADLPRIIKAAVITGFTFIIAILFVLAVFLPMPYVAITVPVLITGVVGFFAIL